LVSDVSGQPIGLIVKGQAVQLRLVTYKMNGRVISEYAGKFGIGRGQFKVLYRHLFVGSDERRENASPNKLLAGRDTRPGLPERDVPRSSI
jgi:hypothetical protein